MLGVLYNIGRKILPPIARYTTVPLIRKVPRQSAAIVSIHHYEPDLLYKCLVQLKQHYKVVPLSVLLDDFFANKLDSRTVAITLDDGILIQVRTIANILEQLQLPATFFVCPDFIDSDQIYWWEEVRLLLSLTQKDRIQVFGQKFTLKRQRDRFRSFQQINKIFYSKTEDEIEQMLESLRKACNLGKGDLPVHHSIRMATSEDIARLARSELFEIGSHSMDHPWLSLQSDEEIEYQIGGSKQRLEMVAGTVSDCFCYPYGPLESIGDNTLAITKKHYRAALTAQYGRVRANDDPMLLKRVALMPGDSFSIWEAKINGIWKQVGHYL